MSTMVRMQIYIKKGQSLLVKREAKELGISAAEVIRRRIDVKPSPVRFRTRPNPAAIKPFFDLIEKRKALGQAKKGWKWNREELYEERMSRYGR